MPHPFGLFARGISLALGWWLLLSVCSFRDGDNPFTNLAWRWGAWAAGIAASGSLVLALHRRERAQLAGQLQASRFHGLYISLGAFPSPPATNSCPLPAVVQAWIQGHCSLPQPYLDALQAVVARLDADQVAVGLKDCQSLYQAAKEFRYTGLKIGDSTWPPRSPDFALNRSDPLITILAFCLQWPVAGGIRALLAITSVRELPHHDQHVLAQVLAHHKAVARLPFNRATDGSARLSIRDDRTAALLGLVSTLNPPDVPEIAPELPSMEPIRINPLFQMFYDLVHEPGRINGQKQDQRLGFIFGEHLYLHWQATVDCLTQAMVSSGVTLTLDEVARRLPEMLAEKGMLVTTMQQQQFQAADARFTVVFTGKLGEQEHRNVFKDMLIVKWGAHFPLMSRLRNSRFTPEVIGHFQDQHPLAPTQHAPSPPKVRKAAPGTPVPQGSQERPVTLANATAACPSPHDSLQGAKLRDCIADLLREKLEGAGEDWQLPVRQTVDPEGRQWFYVGLETIRNGFLPGITDEHVRKLMRTATPGVSSIKNRSQNRIYGFCRDYEPASPDLT